VCAPIIATGAPWYPPHMWSGSAMRLTACVVAACLVGISCRQAAAPARDQTAPETTAPKARVLEVGDPAPDFSLPGTDGKQYSLSTYRGRQTVVLAWFAKAFTEG
jgi:cytochrome oxidase Cu insertion factor (SCO1/SenC/PrrC family)